jgi:hypothetical protein
MPALKHPKPKPRSFSPCLTSFLEKNVPPFRATGLENSSTADLAAERLVAARQRRQTQDVGSADAGDAAGNQRADDELSGFAAALAYLPACADQTASR